MRKRDRSVWGTWFVSYIIILLIPTISGFVNYRMNVKDLNQGILDNYESNLDGLQESINHLLTMQEEFYFYVFQHDGFEYLRSYGSPSVKPDGHFQLEISELYKDINSYTLVRDNAINCAIYLRNVDYLVSNHLTNELDSCYRSLKYDNPNMYKYSEWEEQVKRTYINEFSFGTQLTDINSEALVFAHTLRGNIYNDSTIFVSIPIQKIEQITDGIEAKNYLVFYINGEPTIAFSEGKKVDVPQDIIDGTISEQWVRMDRDSREREITYSFFVSKDLLKKSLEHTETTFLVNISFTLVFGIIGCLLLLRNNYNPLRKLLNKVSVGKTTGNEFMNISRAYSALEIEKQTSKALLEKQRAALRSSSLLTLMKGRSTLSCLKEQQFLLIPDIKDKIALVGFMLPVSEERDIEDDNLLFFVVDNIFQELMTGYSLFCIEDGRFLFYLVELHEGEDKEYISLAIESAEHIYALLKDKFHISLNCIVGGTVNQLGDVPLLYQQVMRLFEFQFSIGNDGVVSAMEMEGQNDIYKLDEQVHIQLKNALLENNPDSAMAIINHLLCKNKQLPFSLKKINAYDLLHNMFVVLREYEPDPEYTMKILSYAELLMKVDDVEGLHRFFQRVVMYVAGRISRQLQRKNDNVTEQIKEYIRQNYAKRELNLSTIAEHMNRTSRSISKLFKEENGEGILEYINHVRVNRALVLMKEKHCKMDEIAEAVGYLDARDFRRAFVKIMGTTPSKYMKKDFAEIEET